MSFVQQAAGVLVRAGSKECSGPDIGGDQTQERLGVADCQASSCGDQPGNISPLDWQCREASLHLYDQASAEAFASSKQALQAFARLAARSPKSQPALQQRGRYRSAHSLTQEYSSGAAQILPRAHLQHSQSAEQLIPSSDNAASASTVGPTRSSFEEVASRAEAAAAEPPNFFLQQAAVSAFERLALVPAAEPARRSSTGCCSRPLQHTSPQQASRQACCPVAAAPPSADCCTLLQPGDSRSQSLSSPFGCRPGAQPSHEQQLQNALADAACSAAGWGGFTCAAPNSFAAAMGSSKSRSFSAEPSPFSGGLSNKALSNSPFGGQSNSEPPSHGTSGQSLGHSLALAAVSGGRPPPPRTTFVEEVDMRCCIPGIQGFENIDVRKELHIGACLTRAVGKWVLPVIMGHSFILA